MGLGEGGERVWWSALAKLNDANFLFHLVARRPGKSNWLWRLASLWPPHGVPGLGPGIHAKPRTPTIEISCNGAACMAGPRPAVTTVGRSTEQSSLPHAGFSFSGQPCAYAGRNAG